MKIEPSVKNDISSDSNKRVIKSGTELILFVIPSQKFYKINKFSAHLKTRVIVSLDIMIFLSKSSPESYSEIYLCGVEFL